MGTTAMEPEVKSQALAFPVQEFDVDAMKPTILALKINGIEDKANQKLVKEWRLKCMRMRTGIESKRKEFKEVWLRGGQAVDATAKRLQTALEPLEQHCIALEAEVQKELDRIEQERQDAIYRDRVEKLKAVGPHGTVVPEKYLRDMSPARFEEYLTESIETAARKAEDARKIAEQAEANRIESERIAKEREAFERQQYEAEMRQTTLRLRMRDFQNCGEYPEASVVEAMTEDEFATARQSAIDRRDQREHEAKEREERIKEQQRAIDAENQRIADANAERIRQEAIDKAAKEAADNAARETEARIAREAEVAEQERLAEVARAQKEAALRPAREKLNAFCVKLFEVERPLINPEVDAATRAAVNACIRAIGKIADGLEVA